MFGVLWNSSLVWFGVVVVFSVVIVWVILNWNSEIMFM